MLEHEPQKTPQQILPQTPPTPQIPAAQRRVSAEELTRAVSALENTKAAEQAAGVAPIGQVVEELGLDSTPEEIWAEVQKQRAQKAAEAVPKLKIKLSPAGQTLWQRQALQIPKIGRQVQRVRRGMGGWIWVLFWCTGGFGLITGLPHFLHSGVGQIETIGGDSTTETVSAQGKNIIILGDGDKITLTGQARSVVNLGERTTLRGEAPKAYESLGDHSDVQWTNSFPPQISDNPHTTQIETKQTGTKHVETKQTRPAGTP